MKVCVTEELTEIFRSILAEGRSIDEWARFESDDIYQSGKFRGGFDATERAFCFSLYVAGKEYWFQLTLEEVSTLSERPCAEIEARLADH